MEIVTANRNVLGKAAKPFFLFLLFSFLFTPTQPFLLVPIPASWYPELPPELGLHVLLLFFSMWGRGIISLGFQSPGVSDLKLDFQ